MYFKNSNRNFNENFNDNYNRQNVSQNQQIFKSSGATYSKIKYKKSNKPDSEQHFYDETIVNAWRKTKFGLMLATVTPYAGENGKGLKVVESEKATYKKMICSISQPSLGIQNTYHVLMNVKTQVIVISELSLCITPNGSGVTRSGKRVTGYFGRNYKK